MNYGNPHLSLHLCNTTFCKRDDIFQMYKLVDAFSRRISDCMDYGVLKFCIL